MNIQKVLNYKLFPREAEKQVEAAFLPSLTPFHAPNNISSLRSQNFVSEAIEKT